MPVSSHGFWLRARARSHGAAGPGGRRASNSSNFKRNALFAAVDGAFFDWLPPQNCLSTPKRTNYRRPARWRADSFGPPAAAYPAHPTPDLHEPAMRQFHPFHSQLYLGKGRALYCGPLQHLEAHAYGAPVLHVGIYGPFRMMLGDGAWRSYRAASCRLACVMPSMSQAACTASCSSRPIAPLRPPSAAAFPI